MLRELSLEHSAQHTGMWILKEIKTYGDKWSTFQVINFKNASQPYYVLLSPSLEVLNTPQQYTNKETYYNEPRTTRINGSTSNLSDSNSCNRASVDYL